MEAVRFFVLSLKVGGSGLNLTAASHVVHFDRWWNPAVENQATDRAFRIGQAKNVLVHRTVSALYYVVFSGDPSVEPDAQFGTAWCFR